MRDVISRFIDWALIDPIYSIWYGWTGLSVWRFVYHAYTLATLLAIGGTIAAIVSGGSLFVSIVGLLLSLTMVFSYIEIAEDLADLEAGRGSGPRVASYADVWWWGTPLFLIALLADVWTHQYALAAIMLSCVVDSIARTVVAEELHSAQDVQ